MAVEECPNCFNTVVFNTSGICPSCNNSKFVLLGNSIKKPKIKSEIEEYDLQIELLRKKIFPYILTGSIITLIVLALLIFLLLINSFMLFWGGGLFIGLSMVGKGIKCKWDIKELKILKEKEIKRSKQT